MAITYHVAGMSCDGCVRAVTNAITSKQPDVRVAVSLDKGEVAVDGDHQEAAIIEAIEDAGFDYVGRDAG